MGWFGTVLIKRSLCVHECGCMCGQLYTVKLGLLHMSHSWGAATAMLLPATSDGVHDDINKTSVVSYMHCQGKVPGRGVLLFYSSLGKLRTGHSLADAAGLGGTSAASCTTILPTLCPECSLSWAALTASKPLQEFKV